MDSRVVALIPARYDSARFPGKVLEPMFGSPILGALWSRLSKIPGTEILVCTTDRLEDSPIRDFCKRHDLRFRADSGPVFDVLGRLYRGASETKADVVVRANADSPLLSPALISLALEQLSRGKSEMVTGKNRFTGIPAGLCGDIFSFSALQLLHQAVENNSHREHVTSAAFSGEIKLSWEPLALTGTKQNWLAQDFTVDLPTDISYIESKFRDSRIGSPFEWEPLLEREEGSNQ